MKIAIFHELHNGGARRAVNEIAKRLKKKHTVDLYIVDTNPDAELGIYFHKVHFYKFLSKKWKGKNWRAKFYKDTVELLKLHSLHKEIAKIIDARNYDVVFVHPSQFTQSPFILRFLKTRCVYYCQEVLRIAYENELKVNNTSRIKGLYEHINRTIRKKIDKKNISFANKIFVNSFFTQKNLFNLYGKRSEVCYLGVDTKFFKPGKVKKDIDILFIGAKTLIEGYPLLNSSLKKLPPNIHVIILDGSEWVSDEKLVNIYQRSKIVVCLATNEPFGLVPLEAGACGVPVVALNQGGYKETVLNDKTGYLISSNVEHLSKCIQKLLNNSYLGYKIGNNSRINIFANWTWDKLVKEIEKNLAMA